MSHPSDQPHLAELEAVARWPFREYSRRHALAFAGTATIAALLPLGAPPATAAGMRSVAQVIAEARSYVGYKLAGSPWQSYFGGLSTNWCAMFASWLIRDQAGPKSSSSTAVYDWYAARGRVGRVPEPGALILYTEDGTRNSIFHIGIVATATGGTIEGNTPGTLPYTQTAVKQYSSPWSSGVLYAYPEYSDSGTVPAQPVEENDVVIYEATSNSSDGVIAKGQIFIQGADGPLRWMSGLEKGSYDYWANNGIPYRRAPWSGNDIRQLVTMVGMYNVVEQSSMNGQLLIGNPLRTVGTAY